MMAGGTKGSWPAFTPPTALTAGETRVALLDYMNEKKTPLDPSIWLFVAILKHIVPHNSKDNYGLLAGVLFW